MATTIKSLINKVQFSSSDNMRFLFKHLLLIACTMLLYLSSASGQHREAIFVEGDELIDQYRSGDLLDYDGLLDKHSDIKRLLRDLSTTMELTDQNYLAYHCLAYNLTVVKQVLDYYPIHSTKQIKGFFGEVVEVSGQEFTLESLKSHLIKKYRHGVIHFLLIDGGTSSPSLPRHHTIRSDKASLDTLLNSFLATRKFAYVNLRNQLIYLSDIFQRHGDDFGGVDRVVALIESANTTNLNGFKVRYDKYDWALNDTKNGLQNRFYPTRLLTKGEYELRLNENYFTRSDENPNSAFNTRTSSLSHNINMIIGSNQNINLGIVARVRSTNVFEARGVFNYLGGVHVLNNNLAITNGVETYRRFGLTAIGPQLRYRPKIFNRGSNVIVHTLRIPIGEDLEGSATRGFIDWEGVSLFNQWLYDYDIGDRTNLYYDIGFNIENIDGRLFRQEGGNVNISSPTVVIYHFYPAPKWTLYATGRLNPRVRLQNFGDFNVIFDPSAEVGGGMRHYLTESIEVDIWITQVLLSPLRTNAQTINIGLRYSVR